MISNWQKAFEQMLASAGKVVGVQQAVQV